MDLGPAFSRNGAAAVTVLACAALAFGAGYAARDKQAAQAQAAPVADSLRSAPSEVADLRGELRDMRKDLTQRIDSVDRRLSTMEGYLQAVEKERGP